MFAVNKKSDILGNSLCKKIQCMRPFTRWCDEIRGLRNSYNIEIGNERPEADVNGNAWKRPIVVLYILELNAMS